MSSNITKHNFIVSRQRREKVNGHKGMVLWFTGLPASGKSTIANNLDDKLNTLGKREPCYLKIIRLDLSFINIVSQNEKS